MNPSAHHAHSMKRSKRGCKNHRVASLTLVPGKIMEQILLKVTSRPVRDKVTGNRHHYQPNLLVFCDEPCGQGESSGCSPWLTAKTHLWSRWITHSGGEKQGGLLASGFSSQWLEIWEVASCKWSTSGAGTGDYCYLSYPLGWWDRAHSSLKMTPDWMLEEDRSGTTQNMEGDGSDSVQSWQAGVICWWKV